MKPARRILRYLRRHPLARRLARWAMRGDDAHCPCCGSSFRRFRAFNGPDRMCWVCDSLERQRLIGLYLDRNAELLREGMTVVHVAPELSLRRRFENLPGVTYHGGDLNREFGSARIDVTDLGYADRSIDVVICNHVLEHVPDDRKAMTEIRRVLRPDGWALVMVPDLEGEGASVTDEEPGIDDPEEQLRRFGQRDHVRRYGWDYLDRLHDAGLSAEVIRPDGLFDSATIERCRLAKRGSLEPIFIARPRDDEARGQARR